MLHKFFFLLLISVACVLSCAAAEQPKPLTLVGWGVDENNLEPFLAQAEAVGFDALITASCDPVFLAKAVEASRPHGIVVFSCIKPESFGLPWHEVYPNQPIPLQKMTAGEDAALSFLSAGTNKYLVPYQWGGEPVLTNEVLLKPIPCPNNAQARDLLKPTIDQNLSVPGIGGLAFDGFGYQNYRRCYCDDCVRRFAEFRTAHAELSEAESEKVYFRDVLVEQMNALADYARSKKADVKTALHIWPVFAPEPLYGNRLNVDFCGQTAAWYTIWPEAKIADYSRIITRDAKKYHSRQEGVGMIGYFDKPGKFPVKDAVVVDAELRTMLGNGCRQVQVCATQDVIGNEKVAAVFRKYFKAQ